MPINITMPALSPTMEEGNLAKWLVKEGDKVTAGDVIAEIETDKATMEVEAVDEGIVAKLVVAAGTQGVKVNSVIAILAGEGEDAAAARDAGAVSAASPTVQTGIEASPSSPASAIAAPVSSTGPSASGNLAAGNTGQARVFASPLARRIAAQQGLDLARIGGTGPHGRIHKRDVEQAAASGTAKAEIGKGIDAGKGAASASATASLATPSVSMAAGMSAEQTLKLFAEGSYELVKHDNMRKTIARRLQESKQSIPHFYVTVDCEIDALLKLRQDINAAAPLRDGKPAYKISVNDMVIKALALALRDVPEANVSWTDEYMVQHKHADVGVAVSIPGGLITPIVRRAEEKSLSTISMEMGDYGKRAKERKLKPEEYQGGTTAVSNMGMMGVKDFAAVVNPPHATILAVGAGREVALVKKGEIGIGTVMSVTLSTDHRAVDGALAARLLQSFKSYIEQPMSMLI